MNKAGHPYLLRVFSTILHQMKSKEELNSVCEIILFCLELKRLTLIDRYLLNQISLIICGKISISINADTLLHEQVLNLMDFMLENELVNEIFQDFISHWVQKLKIANNWQGYVPKESALGKSNLETIKEDEELPGKKAPRKKNTAKPAKAKPIEFKRPMNRIEKALFQNLLFLFDLKPNADKYFKKDFGYSLLDLEGNIIWADKRTCNNLDLKKADFVEKDSKVNLFELMIPPSRQYLKYKFSGQLFSQDTKLGDSISMSYVIYSRVAM